MHGSTPLREPHTSTSDLLTWSELPPADSTATVSHSGHRSRHRQPSDKISEVLHGSHLIDEEPQSLANKKPCSKYKMKEMNGSGIFSADTENAVPGAISRNSNNRISRRIYQQGINGISQILFSTEGSISPPKKPTSLTEVAKQRELCGTLQSEPDTMIRKQISNAKTKELSGNNIFGPASEILPHLLAAARTMESKESKDIGEPVPQNLRTSVKVSNPAGSQSNILFGEEPVKKTSRKIHNQKFAELTGNNIFKEDVPSESAEKPLSRAKLRDMSGSDIFANGMVETRDYIRGTRKPPGGESSIALG